MNKLDFKLYYYCRAILDNVVLYFINMFMNRVMSYILSTAASFKM